MEEAPFHSLPGQGDHVAAPSLTSGHVYTDPESDTPPSDITSPQNGAQQSDSARPPRRRNKPSLSCQACTTKKTKNGRTKAHRFVDWLIAKVTV
ncbi:MAG: hypothetical protein Q9223_003615 [Gallowayella weberi]